ncbi:MAG: NADH-quinone oxidoreductase subunit J [Puniceicoccaceae bacterium]|nr:MAG: NADH-quinone oxidoreductase subunit J [Puniceicoccaceae bacterium]
MVISPNVVTGAMCMIISFVATAALFVLLEAYFLAVLQILVYAGAVMVIFLFIIMLLDADKDSSQLLKDKMTLAGSIAGFALLVVLICAAFAGGEHLPEPPLLPVVENPSGEGPGIPYTTSAKSFGYSLFTKYMLPFQVAGFLLLAAMIGVIVVSKKQQEN